MKNLVTMTLMSLAISATASAATSFQGVIDLSKASNNAKYPTEINAGKYSVTVTIESSKASSVNNIALNKFQYRDDNDIVCSVNGAFSVAQTTVKVKSLTSDWESTSTQNTFVALESQTTNGACLVDTSVFAKTDVLTVQPASVTVELPIKDARFNNVKLSINPLSTGVKAEYTIVNGDLENTLQVSKPGLPLKEALTNVETQEVSYSLSLEVSAGSFFHFDRETTQAKKIK